MKLLIFGFFVATVLGTSVDIHLQPLGFLAYYREELMNYYWLDQLQHLY